MILGLLALAIWVWALVDAALAREFRLGQRWLWIVVIALFLAVGAIVYLVLGKAWGSSTADEPARPAPPPQWHGPPTRPRGPDDDPDFLRSL